VCTTCCQTGSPPSQGSVSAPDGNWVGVGEALPQTAAPRLRATEQATALQRATQVAINDVCRTITGSTRGDHTTTRNLLNWVGVPSFTELAICAVAGKTWSAYHSTGGTDGDRNPVGVAVFGSRNGCISGKDNSRTSRAVTAGLIKVPLRGEKTFVRNAATVRNALPDLRAATTRLAAIRAASCLARATPL
jgi:hypothetical protein